MSIYLKAVLIGMFLAGVSVAVVGLTGVAATGGSGLDMRGLVARRLAMAAVNAFVAGFVGTLVFQVGARAATGAP